MRKPKIVREIEEFSRHENAQPGVDYIVLLTPEEKQEFDAYAKEQFFMSTASGADLNTFRFGGVKFTLQVQTNLRFIPEINSIN